MKKVIILLLIYVSSYNLTAQYTAIPDYCFELNLINNNLDTIQDGFVLTANIINVTSLHLNLICGNGISDLTGIQAFKKLRELVVIDHQLSNLDLSENLELEYLRCMYNQIDILDVSMLIELKHLECYANPISSIDVTNNSKLEVLEVGGSAMAGQLLKKLDVSNNTGLVKLYCYDTQVTELNLNNNLLLENLNCGSNKLQELDLSKNSKLIRLNCNHNNLTCLNIKNGKNINITNSRFSAYNNPELMCIEVDDSTWSANNWEGSIDQHTIFSDSCANECSTYLSIETYHCKPTIYPNPNRGTFSFNSNNISQGLIKMYNVFGIEVFSKKIPPKSETQIKTDLSQGMYLLRFIGSKSEYMNKIIIK